MSNKKSGLSVRVSGDNDAERPNSGLKVSVAGASEYSVSEAQVDLVFVIDTTGSMSDKIQSLLATCERFVDELSALQLDQRIAIVAFGDLTVPGDKIASTSFTSKIEVIRKSLHDIPRYSGGANDGESALDALVKAMRLPFRQSAIKGLVLITDEPALEHNNVSVSEVLRRLTQGEFLTFVVSPPLNYYKDMAYKNGGKWYQISANSNLSELLELFQQMANKISSTVADVHKLGGGSVSNYLALKPPDK